MNSNEISGQEAVMVYILFTDVVGGSRLANEDQQNTNVRLTELVRRLRDFEEAQAKGELISIDTGDGVALVFFNRVEAPLRCAVEIAKALQTDPFCQLRMGIHSGLVYLRKDFNDRTNVTGEGINFAQRVMSCGGAGHILLSDAIAGRLNGLAAWKGKLRYLGEFQAKQDTVRAWSFQDAGIGSDAPLPARPVHRGTQRRWIAVAAAALLGTGSWYGWTSMQPQPPAEHSFRYELFLLVVGGNLAPISQDQLPRSNSKLKMQFTSPEPGFLYVLSEGRGPNGAQWNWIFPEPGHREGSAELNPSSALLVPTPKGDFLEFDSGPAEEQIHLLWSKEPLEAMEAAKKSLFTRMQGDELSASEAASVTQVMGGLEVAARLRKGAETLVHAAAQAFTVKFTLGHL